MYIDVNSMFLNSFTCDIQRDVCCLLSANLSLIVAASSGQQRDMGVLAPEIQQSCSQSMISYLKYLNEYFGEIHLCKYILVNSFSVEQSLSSSICMKQFHPGVESPRVNVIHVCVQELTAVLFITAAQVTVYTLIQVVSGWTVYVTPRPHHLVHQVPSPMSYQLTFTDSELTNRSIVLPSVYRMLSIVC